MDKASLSERDICTKYITPAILATGWSRMRFREEVQLAERRMSSLEIDDFYRQLKTEMTRGWIVEPESAYVREVAA
jgi:type I site-specific restriction endonuclease